MAVCWSILLCNKLKYKINYASIVISCNKLFLYENVLLFSPNPIVFFVIYLINICLETNTYIYNKPMNIYRPWICLITLPVSIIKLKINIRDSVNMFLRVNTQRTSLMLQCDSLSEGQISTATYIELTNHQQYIRFTSCHPNSAHSHRTSPQIRKT